MADILSDISQDPDITLHILDNYIGSAYSPQVEVTETDTGHTVAITYDDAEDGITTKTFDVEDGEDYVLTTDDRDAIAGIVENDLNPYVEAMQQATAAANTAEQARATAESGRATAEQGRQSAETSRESAEGTRTQAESQRAESECQRAAAEQSRATAETSRATAETQRNSAEQARQTAEGARVIAEQARAQAETQRAESESQRASAETSRATAEATRASEWATIKTAAQAATAGAENVNATMTKSGSIAAVTVTDRNGTAHTATLTDGVSPTASVERVEGGALVTVTDASGTTTAMLNDDIGISGAADALMGDPSESMWSRRTSTGSGMARVESVQGATVVWNQLVGSDTSSVTVPSGHKYLGIIGGTSAIAMSDGTAVSVTGGTDQLFDLTAMFGAGNEPATVAEFEAMYPEPYYPYSEPTLKPVQIAGIQSVGFNQLDPANVRMDIFVNGATGKIATGTGTQTVIAEVLPNTDYCLTYTNGNRCNIAGVDSLTPAVGDDARVIFAASTSTSPKVFNSGDNRYIAAFIATSAATASNVCINVSNPALNGQYKPYTTDSVEWSTQTLRAVGSVADMLYSDHVDVRVGVVDLGTLTWIVAPNSNTEFRAKRSDNPDVPMWVGTTGNVVSNCKCAEYESVSPNAVYLGANRGIAIAGDSYISVGDSTYTTAADFKAAMAGVLLYYPLATPTTTLISPALPMTYKVEQGGTESIIVPEGEVSAAPVLTVAEGESAADLVMDALACIATPDGPVATANHAINTYLTMQGKLYKVTSAIAVGETIAAGTNVTQTTVMAELIARTA